MKRSRPPHFDANDDASSNSSPQGASALPPLRADSQQSIGHIPKISRKIKACSECKRHKVKCDLKAGESTCHRCRRMGLDCVVNKSLQTLLDDEAEWKTTIELAMADLLNKAELPNLSYYQAAGRSAEPPPKKIDRKPSTVSTDDAGVTIGHDRRTNSVDINAGAAAEGPDSGPRSFQQESQFALDREENGVSSLVNAPMRSLYEVTQLSEIQTNTPKRQYDPNRALITDIISRGLVGMEEAQELFLYFDRVLNRYLWDGMALVHKDLAAVRNSSSMLTAAILTVTALHIEGKESTFDTCYHEFARLASASMLEHHTLDDLRALCIGAFWLADISWKLSGHCVRIATELGLHQSYRKATQGSSKHIEQARLWYLLYTLEHHFSIAYGRPPIIHEDHSIKNHNAFTSSPTTTQAELRLHSQVDLFIILTRIYDAFGPDVDLEVPESEFDTINEYDVDLEKWKFSWLPRLAGSQYVGAYPYKAVYLHYHFSRLQLNSVALRTYHSSNSARTMSEERKKRANLAIESATKTLLVVLDEPDIQTALIGVPLYLHSMITFAAVFLLKIAAKGCSNNIPGSQGQQNSIASAGLLINVAYVRALVGRVVELMVSCSGRASERHLSHHIARGLRKMLTGLEEWEKRNACGQQPSGLRPHEYSSMFKPIIIPGAQPLGEKDTILNHPPPLLGVAPLSAERGNSFGPGAVEMQAQTGLSEGSLDPMMPDLWGFDEEYFPTGVFDFLQSQMPA